MIRSSKFVAIKWDNYKESELRRELEIKQIDEVLITDADDSVHVEAVAFNLPVHELDAFIESTLGKHTILFKKSE